MTAKEQGLPQPRHRRWWRIFAIALVVMIMLAMVALNEVYRTPQTEEPADAAATVLVDPAS